MNDAGEIVGMVDVLKLTYATLEQVSNESLVGPKSNSLTFLDQFDADGG